MARSTPRQPTHPQQIRQFGAVPDIVLDSPVLERLPSQRVRKMDLGTGRLGRLAGPLPAIRGLEHDLRRLARAGNHTGQPVGVIDDPHRLQRLVLGGAPDNQAASSMRSVPTNRFPAAYCGKRSLLRR